MGIKGLWTVMAPYCEKKSLHEVRGETLAVDLSGWICDSQNVTDYYIQPKLYLRNLFFRTAYLLLADINPVFVLEGDAPELKRDVMAARNAIQFCGAAPRQEGKAKNPDVGRRKFKGVLKECESLLRTMGVRCVKGAGEAEATCARLNAKGLVDAVVSQDSDCFAYGARKVYRNFSVSNSAGGGALQGSVDCYDAECMFQANGFGRKKMIALALLCGCDYGVGACGLSITTAVAFLHTVPEEDVIPRLLSWVTDVSHYEERSRWLAVPGRCDRCGHAGKSHVKNGCPVCVTHKGCNDTGHKTKVAELKKELSLRSRALTCGMPFPEPKVMKEFLHTPDENVDWDKLAPTPSLIQFIKVMTYKLDWSEKYCVMKFLPLLTKWHLQDLVPCRTIEPIAIKKKRNPRGVPSFEIVWGDIDGQYEGLIPDDQFEDNQDPSDAWTTVERQDLIRKYYPELVEKYEEATKKPVKEKKTRGKKKKEEDGSEKPKRKYNKKVKQIVEEVAKRLSESIQNGSLVAKSDLNNSKLNVSVSVNKLKRKIKNTAKSKNQKTIDSFIAKKRRKSNRNSVQNLQCSFKQLSINDSNDRLFAELLKSETKHSIDNDKENVEQNKHFLSILNDTEDVDEINLSEIVDNVVAKAPVSTTTKLNNNVVKLVFDKYSTPKKSVLRKSVLTEIKNNCSTPKNSPNRKSFRFSENFALNNSAKVNTSYFFDKLTDECDAFEMSLDNKCTNENAIVLDADTTVDYSLPDVCL